MRHVAIDLGASNGRVLTARVEQGMSPDEIEATADVAHRFPTHVQELSTGLHWDIEKIFSEIKTGLKRAFNTYGSEIVSIGIDSWGVDFTLLDKEGQMLFPPYHYRDKRTDGVPEELFKVLPKEELYRETGVQIMQLNTVFQLFAMTKTHPEILEQAAHYLSVPDLLTFWLTGEKINERSHASTTQIFAPEKESWSEKVLDVLGLSPSLFHEVTPSGTIIGPPKKELRDELGIPASVHFVASASHDTQSAAYTVGRNQDRAFISCGTWSILGIEKPRATLTDKALQQDFSNEASGFGGYNLLKNIMGFWILQECKAEWDEDTTLPKMGYDTLVANAGICDMPESIIDVNDPLFLKARQQGGSMADRINTYLSDRGLTTCSERGEYTRVIIQSLAQYYGKTAAQLALISGSELKELHLIGGGAKNQLLAKLTAEETGLKVVIGAIEATAIGNILIQRKGLGIA